MVKKWSQRIKIKSHTMLGIKWTSQEPANMLTISAYSVIFTLTICWLCWLQDNKHRVTLITNFTNVVRVDDNNCKTVCHFLYILVVLRQNWKQASSPMWTLLQIADNWCMIKIYDYVFTAKMWKTIHQSKKGINEKVTNIDFTNSTWQARN